MLHGPRVHPRASMEEGLFPAPRPAEGPQGTQVDPREASQKRIAFSGVLVVRPFAGIWPSLGPWLSGALLTHSLLRGIGCQARCWRIAFSGVLGPDDV